MDRNHRGDMTNVSYLSSHGESYYLGDPGCEYVHPGAAADAHAERRGQAVHVLIYGLISLGFWPLGPIAAWLGIMACSRRRGLHGSHLWMALTGTVAGILASAGLAAWLVARVSLHLV